MENNTISELSAKERFIHFFKKNKITIFSIIFILIILLFLKIIFQYKEEKKHDEISEKFIKAGIYLSNKENKKSKDTYYEIILSKNKFYSILALNNILDNDLEENKEEIIKLFNIVENIKMNKDQIELLKLKKALYLIKISRVEEGKKILQGIVDKESSWKEIAQEILKK